jgi:hypothetical protein
VTDLSDLPPRERTARYRALANDADAYARNSVGTMRSAYETMAAQWRKLADEAEALANKAESGAD